MSAQVNVNVGKSKIAVAVSGCVNCGTESSESWSAGQPVRVSIEGASTQYVTLPVCRECKASLEAESDRGARP